MFVKKARTSSMREAILTNLCVANLRLRGPGASYSDARSARICVQAQSKQGKADSHARPWKKPACPASYNDIITGREQHQSDSSESDFAASGFGGRERGGEAVAEEAQTQRRGETDEARR